VKRLKDFAQNRAVSGAVSGQPDPPVCSGIPAESPRAPACLRLCASARAGVPMRLNFSPCACLPTLIFAPSLRFRESRSDPVLDLG
jgi:hypothetical protein